MRGGGGRGFGGRGRGGGMGPSMMGYGGGGGFGGQGALLIFCHLFWPLTFMETRYMHCTKMVCVIVNRNFVCQSVHLQNQDSGHASEG